MAYFICEKQGRCCPHEFYDSIEQAITDSEDGVPCDHLIEVAPMRHGRWVLDEKRYVVYCSECSEPVSYYPNIKDVREENHYCPNCGCRMDGGMAYG